MNSISGRLRTHGEFAILTGMDITMDAMQRFTRDELLEDLLRQVARGKETAFAELYALTCQMVYGFVLRILREQTATEDTVQEIYVQVWQKAKVFDHVRGKAITWILTIARSRALDKLRSSRLGFGCKWVEDLDNNLESSAPSPEDCCSALQRATLLRRAVALLPPEQRLCILMAFFQGLSHSEIAGQTAIPLGTVKTRIRNGIMRLSEELGTLGSQFTT